MALHLKTALLNKWGRHIARSSGSRKKDDHKGGFVGLGELPAMQGGGDGCQCFGHQRVGGSEPHKKLNEMQHHVTRPDVSWQEPVEPTRRHKVKEKFGRWNPRRIGIVVAHGGPGQLGKKRSRGEPRAREQERSYTKRDEKIVCARLKKRSESIERKNQEQSVLEHPIGGDPQ